MTAGTIANVSCRAIIDLCGWKGLRADELLAVAGIPRLRQLARLAIELADPVIVIE
jgi:hypothetical protein